MSDLFLENYERTILVQKGRILGRNETFARQHNEILGMRISWLLSQYVSCDRYSAPTFNPFFDLQTNLEHMLPSRRRSMLLVAVIMWGPTRCRKMVGTAALTLPLTSRDPRSGLPHDNQRIIALRAAPQKDDDDNSLARDISRFFSSFQGVASEQDYAADEQLDRARREAARAKLRRKQGKPAESRSPLRRLSFWNNKQEKTHKESPLDLEFRLPWGGKEKPPPLASTNRRKPSRAWRTMPVIQRRQEERRIKAKAAAKTATSSPTTMPPKTTPSLAPRTKPDDQATSSTEGEENAAVAALKSWAPVAAAQKWAATLQEHWVDVLPKTRIAPGQVVPVTVHGLDLIIVASAPEGRLYAVANQCPHLNTPLELGRLTRVPCVDTTRSSSTGSTKASGDSNAATWSEAQLSALLQSDGCEDCIVCPLHRTAFSLASGQVRGEWCPYPPVLGPLAGALSPPRDLPTFQVRTRGKSIQVRINTPLKKLAATPDQQ
jgi:nitrite reductase/ring-hydroxylating ferredoxin subunit